VPAIFDLDTREILWTDVAHKQRPKMMSAIESNKSSVSILIRAMTSLRKATLHRLFALHGAARGTLVDEPGAATTRFGVDQAFEIERIMSEFLA